MKTARILVVDDEPKMTSLICGALEDALAFVDKAPFGYPYAVKADGLAAGKGTSLPVVRSIRQTHSGRFPSNLSRMHPRT